MIIDKLHDLKINNKLHSLVIINLFILIIILIFRRDLIRLFQDWK